MSRTELQSSLLQGISAGRVVVVGGAAGPPYRAEHRGRRPRGTGGGRRSREEERRRRRWPAGLGFRVLSREATARIAMAIFFRLSPFSAGDGMGGLVSLFLWRGFLFSHC